MVTRVAVMDRDVCIEKRCGYVCAKVCPPNRMGEECIVVEKNGIYPVFSEALCIGCGLCVKKCPVNCISIINVAQELSDPVFQYGVNTFRLYGLPLPIEGAVSLVGKNGIGKTSAIKLLSRQVKPNFAQFGKEWTDDEVMAKLPIESRRYFAKTREGLKLSVKPQHIDRVREAFKGTVAELLGNVSGSKARLGEIAGLFRIEDILERKLDQLSGGELQKVSVAAAYMKESDIYYFDEVTNYLDIEERLRMAVIIKELAERRSVMMAEHDLTFLDYVSNYVYILYGDENVYGVVSGVKNVRVGINEYIAGYLKDENVRFRGYEIGFSKHSEGEIKAAALVKYGAMAKEFKGKSSGFRFSSDPGEIKKGEILGLVGKNALGKSLFVKMLAGVERADDGEQLGLRISYKPQYITAEPVVVSAMFAGKDLNMGVLEECKRKLNITMLMDKELNQLSGGELQRVALTLALSQNADAYLFDEPSAFLDIEQRFEFASLLRRVISESEKCAFVVDHDIVFIDAIANRLVVFDGKSSMHGHASAPLNKRSGMNGFLKVAGITMRRDRDSSRPRINKPGSQLDSEQKAAGEYFYFDRASEDKRAP
ncbi:ribosome biogenesis/translation initiation ATPase RLI [Candidatus Micrarchaeota archaeon]|nr:ribosome biogenesis/translation initiation ATPase RLI [Candidatus Micrarchaeota archaeon]